jgi:hypothetical protein
VRQDTETKIEGLAGRVDALGCAKRRMSARSISHERNDSVAPSIRKKPSNATGSCKATMACIGDDFLDIKLSVFVSCNPHYTKYKERLADFTELKARDKTSKGEYLLDCECSCMFSSSGVSATIARFQYLEDL